MEEHEVCQNDQVVGSLVEDDLCRTMVDTLDTTMETSSVKKNVAFQEDDDNRAKTFIFLHIPQVSRVGDNNEAEGILDHHR